MICNNEIMEFKKNSVALLYKFAYYTISTEKKCLYNLPVPCFEFEIRFCFYQLISNHITC